MRVLAVACVCLASVCGSGCAAYAALSSGFASNLGGGEAPAAMTAVVDGEYGGSIGSGTFAWPSLNFHLRAGSDLVQLAPSLSLRGALPSLITPMYGIGFRAMSFESNDGDFGFGMFSPYAQLGLFVATSRASHQVQAGNLSAGGGTGVILHLDTGYDLRFTHQPNAWWGAVSIGYAVYTWMQ